MIVNTEEAAIESNSSLYEGEDNHDNREYQVLTDMHDKFTGRSILFILYDRSIQSSSSASASWNHLGKRKRKMKYLFESGDTSPSSVIHNNNYNSFPILRSTSHSTASNDMIYHTHVQSSKSLFTSPSPPRKKDSDYKSLRVLRKYKNTAYSAKILNEIIHFVEKLSLTKPKSCYLPLFPLSSSSSLRQPHGTLPTTNTNTNTTSTATTVTSTNAVSTIAIAFAPNGRTIASTHGDHTIKISCCHTGRSIRSLIGHLRTPWTVKYHPTNSNIIASGCLGFQVRIWDWNYSASKKNTSNNKLSSNTTQNKKHGHNNNTNNNTNDDLYDFDDYCYEQTKGVCLYTLYLQDSAIISISFHPSGSLLAIASGSMLFLWDYANVSEEELKKLNGSTNTDELLSSLSSSLLPQDTTTTTATTTTTTTITAAATAADITSNNENPAPIVSNKYIPFNFKYTLRCVTFSPQGNTILVAVANPPDADRNNRQEKKGLPYSLCLLNFDIHEAFQKLVSKSPSASLGSSTVLKNVRIIIPRILLYNDGGLDVSYDGKTLCACAEYLLPYGTDCVMDMPENRKDHDNFDDDDDDDEDEEDDHLVGYKDDDNCSEENIMDKISTTADSPPRPSSMMSEDIVDEWRTPPRTDPEVDSMPPPRPPAGTLRRYALEAAQERKLRLQFARPKSAVVSEEQLETAIQTRLVPHIVTVNIDTTSSSKTLGQVLEAAPLSESKAPGVTCVKFSPSTEYCLIGFGVRDKESLMDSNDDNSVHPVLSIYRCKGIMSHVATAFSSDDDVNIALFHPESGHGMAYGTKQGRVKVLAPMPWM